MPVNKGTLVKITAGANPTHLDSLDLIGTPGAAYSNTVSPRWGVIGKVGPASTGDQVLGMLLYDGRETDENGEKLIFNPRKQAEMEVFISGQACPIVTKGVFLYSGDARLEGTVTAGVKVYASGGGLVVGAYNNASNHVGVALSPTGANGEFYVRLNIVN